MWLGAEGDRIKAGVSPQCSHELFRRMDEFRIPFDPRDVNPPELDPSPARGGDHACRFRRREETAEGVPIRGDDLGGEVTRKSEDKVPRLLDRFGPATPQDDGRGANDSIEGPLGSLCDVYRLSPSEGFLDLPVV
jgi:hypothetical protein